MSSLSLEEREHAAQVKFHSKRSIFALPIVRRSNRPHWNPLIAAYRRCAELIMREERESCFKDAIQMLFVHRL